ncbi:MAG: monovalent cation/H+ antiporter complex subunit F [Bdellovibrionia bacterium]
MSLLLAMTLVILGFCLVTAMYRWVWGPAVADRIVLFDLATSIACGILVVASLLFNQNFLLDIALLLAVISFTSTIGLAYWLEKGSDQ